MLDTVHNVAGGTLVLSADMPPKAFIYSAIAPGDLWLILEMCMARGNRWAMSLGLQVFPRWRVSVLAVAGRFLRVRTWQKALDVSERSLQNWTLAVTLLLLLGIAIALLSAW